MQVIIEKSKVVTAYPVPQEMEENVNVIIIFEQIKDI